MKKMISGNEAAAWGARLSRAEVIPTFPITPQTEIIEHIAKWISNKEFDADFIPMESEHSVQSALIASSAAGVRVFSATSSQGLLLMHEMMFIASGLRLPIVMVNVSRGLSAPITLWADHNDILAQRDTGWMQVFCENNQEVIDSIIMGYKIAENEKVLLPMIINLDGFTLSHTSEPVQNPKQEEVDNFLPKYNPQHTVLDPKHPMTVGGAVIDPKDYMYFRYQQRLSMENAKEIITDICKEWYSRTGRFYDLVESYNLDDAKKAIIIMGSESSVAKYTVNKLRDEGEKVGLLRLRVYRPFPSEMIVDALKNIEQIGIIDKNVSHGIGGIVYSEIKNYLPNSIVTSFIAGLGGKNIGVEGYENIFNHLGKENEEWIF